MHYDSESLSGHHQAVSVPLKTNKTRITKTKISVEKDVSSSEVLFPLYSNLYKVLYPLITANQLPNYVLIFPQILF